MSVRCFCAALLLGLTGCGGTDRPDNITFAPGLHYCSFRPETDEGRAWIGFSATPCTSGRPSTNYVEATDWGITGSGLTAIVDRCAERPTVLLWPDAFYAIDLPSAPFDARLLTREEANALTPSEECHTVINGDGYWIDMVETDPEWAFVRKIEV